MEPEGVRQAMTEYLEEQLGCVVRRHRLRFELVSVTGRSRGNVGAFLAALARVSKTVDPTEPPGVSESAILHNEEAYALYRQRAEPPASTSAARLSERPH
jgi:hypothetical protein